MCEAEVFYLNHGISGQESPKQPCEPPLEVEGTNLWCEVFDRCILDGRSDLASSVLVDDDSLVR